MMNRVMLGLFGLVLTGCPVDTLECDEGTELSEDGTVCEEVTCGNSILVNSQYPETGSQIAYYRSTIEASLQFADEGAAIAVTGPDGAVDGTSVADGKRIVFTPTTELNPNTEYTVTLNYCMGAPEWTFKTSEVGGATDASGLVDRTFNLDLASGRFVKPAGVGALLQEYLKTSVLINVLDVDTDTNEISMLGAVAEEGSNPLEQGICSPTIPFPIADFAANPFFEIGPETTALSIQGVNVEIVGLFISGAFSPGGDYIAGAVLSGSIDTRGLVDLVEEGGEDSAICDLAIAINVQCEPCPTDGGNFCLNLFVDNMAAEEDDAAVQRQHVPEVDVTPHADSVDVCTFLHEVDGQQERVCKDDCPPLEQEQ